MDNLNGFEEWFKLEHGMFCAGDDDSKTIALITWQAAISHAQEQSEPVAWIMVTPESGNRILIEDRDEMLRYQSMDSREIIPLYASPQPAQEWINVKDRLPETRITNDKPCILEGRAIPPQINSDWVLVIHLKGAASIVGMDQLTGLEGRGVWWDNYRNNVTHWQPLPVAPK